MFIVRLMPEIVKQLLQVRFHSIFVHCFAFLLVLICLSFFVLFYFLYLKRRSWRRILLASGRLASNELD
jgi:hypothetical protein